MIESVLIALLGTAVGLAIGLLPGLGTSFVLIAAYPILANWPVEWLLMFYVSVATSSQFSGSMSVLMFGVLGEITGQPAMQERKILRNHTDIAVIHTAAASCIAVVVSFFVIAILWYMLPQFVYVLRNEVKLAVLIAFVLLAVFWGGNNHWINMIMIVGGAITGLVGYTYAGSSLLTFDQSWLAGGVPLLPLMVGLVAVPGITKFVKAQFHIVAAVSPDRLPLSMNSVLRGSIIGSVIGLVPIIGNAITSQLAWRNEQRLYHDFSVRHSLNRLTAAEAANNSGNITVLLPLLMFGLPIVPSEMILYNIMSSQGWIHASLTFGTVALITAAAAISAGSSWYLCGPAVVQLAQWTQQYIRQIAAAAVVIAAGSVLYSGYQAYNTIWYTCTLLMSCTIGLACRKLDMSPVLITYLVFPQMVASAIIISQLYF
jgi:putative tricarboxylic transport membrane protein